MSFVLVRLETQADHDSALEVERLAFQGARGGEPADDIVAAIKTIREEQVSFALVAERAAAIVGHVQFSRAWVGESPVVLLGPIGVHPDSQGAGIGSALVRAGLEEATKRGEAAVVLLGAPDFYSRFGFVAGATFGLRNPAVGVQPDGFVVREEDFMIAPLDARAHSLAGRVRWTEAL
jgi:putative acetyltransferase